MLHSYFKIALRYLGKRKIYSFINIAGLSLGLSCAMLILLYTKDELSFDAFHENASSIYQVTVDVRFPDGSSMEKMGVSSFLLGPHVQSNLPEVKAHLRLAKTYWDIKLGDDVQSQSILFADSNFFSLLTFPLLQGNAKTALQQPNSVVITEDMAIRHFGTTDALNKTLLFARGSEFKPYTITGVAKRCPQNSSIQFEAVLPLVIPVERLGDDSWVSVDVNTLLQLSDGSNVAAVAGKMQQLFETASKKAFEPVRASGFNQMFYHQLQPFTDTHLSQEFKAEHGLANGSNPMYSYILSGIAVFILAIACINFVNLTVAQSVKRAKEIGIRKVVGSGRQQLIGQFLGESFLICFISFVSAGLLSQLLLPVFNDITNKALSLSYLLDDQLLAGYIILFLVTGFLAGFYPALVLSGYNPVQTLYNQFRLTGKNYLQRGLVVFQFALATLMIVGTITVYLQFDFLTNKDLGYDYRNLVIVPKSNLTPREAKYFREEITKNPNIELVAPLAHGQMNAKINGGEIKHFTNELVDENFVDILKLQIIQGRNFSSLFPADSNKAIVVNEAFVKMAGWKDPIGEEVDFFLTGEKKLVVGVFKDYHFASLRDSITPQCFEATSLLNEQYYNKKILVRIKPNSEASSLPHIEQTFKRLFPMLPYTYQFAEDINIKNYESESRWKKVILFGTVLTIFISALGLFGLSVLTAERRFKEIGIRKVLGASVQDITLTLTRGFLGLIFIALILAIPIAYYLGTYWLETYPYRVNINSYMIVGAGVLVMTVALGTLSYQSIKAAMMNPVESLKRE
jgi:putative ABC transport system permease protein